MKSLFSETKIRIMKYYFYLDSVVCFALHDPVCGRNGVTYSNSCKAGSGNVHCKGQCPCIGTLIQSFCQGLYDPVCGRDGVTYGNSCQAGSGNVNCAGQCPCRGTSGMTDSDFFSDSDSDSD